MKDEEMAESTALTMNQLNSQRYRVDCAARICGWKWRELQTAPLYVNLEIRFWSVQNVNIKTSEKVPYKYGS